MFNITIKSQLSIVKEECYVTSICDDNIKCSQNGMCFVNLTDYYSTIKQADTNKTNSECVCNIGYTNLPLSEIKCCYKMKSRLNAFILEAFVGCGVSHFYIGSDYLGYIKLSCSIILLVLFYCSLIVQFLKQAKSKKYIKTEINSKNEIKNQNIKNNKDSFTKRRIDASTIICFCSIFIFLVWKIIDIVLIACGFIKDGNNIDLTN